MWLPGRIAACSISALHDVSRQTVSGMDVESLLIDAVFLATGGRAIPSGRTKATGARTGFRDANLIGKPFGGHCFL